MYIAICNDEEFLSDKLQNTVSVFAKQNKLTIHIEKYSDGWQLLNSHKKFDLIFLGIEVGELNSLEIAKEIRKFDLKVQIVFITNYTDYWIRAYKVHAFDFILKPFKEQDIFNVLSDSILFQRDLNSKKVELVTENGVVIQSLNEINYFIVLAKKTLQISTAYNEYIVKENLSDIFKKLNDDNFFMSHRSCIVNMINVAAIKKNNGIFMNNGDWVPLAQRRQKEFIVQLSKQLRK